MSRTCRSIIFRLVALIPMVMLGKEIFYSVQGIRTNHWVAKDGKPVSAVITEVHRVVHGVRTYAYRYVADRKEYIGHDGRNSEEELHSLAVGEETSVIVSKSHPWFSSFKSRQTGGVDILIVFAMTFLECFCLVAVISPRSLDGFKVKQEQPPDTIIQRFIYLLLLQAQKDGATEIIVGTASAFDVPVRCKIEGAWRELPSFPSRMRRSVVSELARMAGDTGQVSGEGFLDEHLGHIRSHWRVEITSMDQEFTLKRIED
jgi:hypothetical protein